MAQANKKPSTAIWLSEAKALLAKGHGGSARVAEELLRDTFQSDPTLWNYRKKKGDAPDGELWQSARIDFAEGNAIKQGHAADPVLLTNDDGLVSFSMRPGPLNKGGVSADGRLLVHRTEWLGIWVSRAHVLALLPATTADEPVPLPDRRRKAGVKPTYDWDAIQAHCYRLFGDDGYPENVSAFCQNKVLPWCERQHGADGTPDLETLRPKLASWIEAWRRSLSPG